MCWQCCGGLQARRSCRSFGRILWRGRGKLATIPGMQLPSLNTSLLSKLFSIACRPSLAMQLLRGTAAGVEHIKALSGLGLRTLLDVGANQGQFSLVARYLYPEVRIVAFEPLEEASRQYEHVVGTKAVVLHRIALGDTEGTRVFYVTDRADSSSLLMPGRNQENAYGVAVARRAEVKVERLDRMLNADDLAGPVLMKIDVQGGELAVLRGSGDLLRAIDYVYVEVSFVELYESQCLAGEVVAYMQDEGYQFRGVYNVSFTTDFGATQADLLFVRSKGTAGSRDKTGSRVYCAAP